MSTQLAARGVEPLTVEVRPPWPYRLPRGSGGDGTSALRGGILCRLLHVEGRPVVVRAWQPQRQRVLLRADAVAPEAVVYPRLQADQAESASERTFTATRRPSTVSCASHTVPMPPAEIRRTKR